MKKITFVCMGNICRSPLAQALFEDKISKNQLNNQFLVDSCGIGDWHVGNLSDKRMIATAQDHGITLNHRSKQFKPQFIYEFDYIFAMDRNNLNDILNQIDKKYQNKVKLFRSYEKTNNQEVPDPYYGGIKGFEEVFQIIDKNCNLILKHLKDN